MIVAMMLLQAVTAPVSAEAREQYQPFRRCLIEQARSLAASDLADEALLDRARSNCFEANLASGTAALFAEMRNGATEDQAGDSVVRLRAEAEQEALATARTIRSNGGAIAEDR
jgi:hypothetical protein